ncbi:CHAP domain-containing protein [Nonomuraea sp. K274]|uniref:CHAP domain-containing protein n=1 Tax=Nonomuraea cypriaca TaxID=1187855 RepID=A0A931F3D1_9ACTN|nr:CHAP domain-containing protein [Nonomuraea cypriaca]MBF8191512.1 CHAP domain-containing protein [Nonomuraea cypriaca]
MAKFRLTAAPKFVAHAVLGAAVLGSALGLQATADAETKQPVPIAHKLAHTDESTKTTDEAKVNVTAKQVLAFAKKQIGTSENAAGGGTPYQQWYAQSQRAAETVARDGGSRADYLNAAWCAMFVSWVGEKTGARPQVGWDAYTVAHAKWFKANDRFGTEAKPGSVVFFSWNGGKALKDIQHVGFVVKDNHNGTISTIEGNTGNGEVEQRTRPTSQVVGYGYPQYAS